MITMGIDEANARTIATPAHSSSTSTKKDRTCTGVLVLPDFAVTDQTKLRLFPETVSKLHFS